MHRATPVAPVPIAGTREATGAREGVLQSVSPLPAWRPGMGKIAGTRDKLTRKVLEAVLEDFRAFGAHAIERVREDDPSTYLRVVASLLPKDIKVESDSLRTVVLDFRGTIAARDEPMVIDQPPEQEPDPDADGQE